MSIKDLFKVSLSKPICIEGFSEDSLRALVEALRVSPKESSFSTVVTSSAGTKVEFRFGSDGNFEGVFAKIDGQQIVLIQGTQGKSLGVFEGPPSSTNPGAGWEVDATLTQKYLNQPPDQTQWEIFYAKRVNVLNTV